MSQLVVTLNTQSLTTILDALGAVIGDAETCADELDTADPDVADIHRALAERARALRDDLNAQAADPRRQRPDGA